MPRSVSQTVPARRAAPDGRIIIWFCLSWLLVLAAFHLLPAADSGFTALFCRAADATPGICDQFPVADHPLTGIFRPVFFWAPVAACLLMLADIAWQYRRNRWTDRIRLRAEAVALGAYLLGPILIVNGLLKAYSGRPRPDDTTLFGGNLDFVAAGDFSGACRSNCSFVSGEAAAAGWLLFVIPLVPRRYRTGLAVPIVLISMATPFLRVAMGGHFLSDALLGWLIGAASIPALTLLSRPLLRREAATLDRVG